MLTHKRSVMEETTRLLYEAPVAKTLELDIEGLICASDVKGGNSINDWGNGGSTNDDLYI